MTWLTCLLGCDGDDTLDLPTIDTVDMPYVAQDMALPDASAPVDASGDLDASCIPRTSCEPTECGAVLDGCGGRVECQRECEACIDTTDCNAGLQCIAKQCRPQVLCRTTGSAQSIAGGCRLDFRALGYDPSVVRAATCLQGLCQVPCLADSECAPGNVCVDDGVCQKVDLDLNAPAPGGQPQTPLMAGVSNVLMTFPIGLPLGGYGSRASNEKTRYGIALSQSRGQFHGLFARALALDNGAQEVVVVRLPIIFPTGPLFEAVAAKMQEEDGKNWRSNLLISATHTHSGPGRLLHLPPPEDLLIPLGFAGTGEFSQQAFDWLVQSTLEAIRAARAAKQPASLGWTIVEAFDTDDAIASDRWGETPPFDDNRVLMVRINDATDKPLAAMISFGMHGTFNDSDFATGDSVAGVERALENKLGQEFDTHIPVLFVNQNSGSMSPRGDQNGHKQEHKVTKLGQDFVAKVWDRFLAIPTSPDLELGAASLRFPLGYETLGYEDGEWIDGTDKENLRLGGILCNVGVSRDSDWTTAGTPGSVRCTAIHRITLNRAPVLFLRSQMTALQLGDLTLISMPGESVMELGWELLREVAREYGLDPLKLWTVGYAQDHKFYLTPTDLRGELPLFPGISTPQAPEAFPPRAFSYYQGGYEAEFNIWGPRMGDFLIARGIELVGLLKGMPIEPKFAQPAPQIYPTRQEEPFAKDPSDPGTVGQIVLAPPTKVKRLEMISFQWIGGDPMAEMPQAPHVVLQRQVAPGQWEDLKAPNTRPYDNRERLMITRVRLPEADSTPWEWAVSWEEGKDFPLGTYRFRVLGHVYDQAFVRTPYTAQSPLFELVPQDAMVITLTPQGNTVTGTIGYPAAQALSIKRGPREHVPTGSYRLRHRDVPTGVSDPAQLPDDLVASGVQVTLAGQPLAPTQISLGSGTQMIEGREVPVTTLTLTLPDPAPKGPLVVTVQDAHGNSGMASIDL